MGAESKTYVCGIRILKGAEICAQVKQINNILTELRNG